MARKISMAALFVVLAATLLQSTFATTYTVGDSTGWIRPANTEFYDNWKGNKNFVVGDILVFNFTTGAHDVAEVNEAAYEACSSTNTIKIWSNGPLNITLNSTGELYFICTFPGHCSAGQKLEVDVRNGTAPTPGSSPNTNTTTGVSPPSSASSLVATLSLVFMSTVLVLLCY